MAGSNGVYMEEKLKRYFEEMVVYKDNTNEALKKVVDQSFLRDWLIKRYQDTDGSVDIEGMTQFVEEHVPKSEAWESIKARIMEGERVKLIAKFDVRSEASTNEHVFSLPDYNLPYKETMIDEGLWANSYQELTDKEKLVQWGQIELEYRPPSGTSKRDGKIVMKRFKAFEPYRIDLDYYKDASRNFSSEEWIDILLGAFDYNAAGYANKVEKLTMLSRLLIFVEKNLNLIELAPPGTAKTYVFNLVSKYGTCISSKVTRSSLFYNFNTRKFGAIFKNDFIALDEIQDETTNDIDEMRKALKEYLEYGTYSTAEIKGSSGAGVILLGNIPPAEMHTGRNMFGYINTLFQEPAIFDRFHGFIEGWDIPRMHDDLKKKGWALNTEYFTSILHLLREDKCFTGIFDALVEPPEKVDTRHTAAIRRICTAWLKLLFPYIRSVDDVDLYEFRQILKRAVSMRQTIWKQIVRFYDGGFADKPVGEYRVKGL